MMLETMPVQAVMEGQRVTDSKRNKGHARREFESSSLARMVAETVRSLAGFQVQGG
jgi:hypothetical protein